MVYVILFVIACALLIVSGCCFEDKEIKDWIGIMLSGIGVTILSTLIYYLKGN